MATRHITKSKKAPFKLSAAQGRKVTKAIDLLRAVQAEVLESQGDEVVYDEETRRIFERLSDAAQYAKSALKD